LNDGRDQNLLVIMVNTSIVPLNNHGNTCYISTTLQCLFNVQSISEHVQNKGPYKQEHDKHNLDRMTIVHLKELFGCQQNRQLDPSAIDQHWKKLLHLFQQLFHDKIEIKRQNDICEFYGLLMEFLYSCFKKKPFVYPDHMNTVFASCRKKSRKSLHDDHNHHHDNFAMGLLGNVKKLWKRYFENNFSELINIFHFTIISQIKCQHCEVLHTNYEFPNMLQLDLCDTMESSIQDFLNPIRLNHSIEPQVVIDWYCDKCKHKRETKKLTMFGSFPNELVIQLKRFQLNPFGQFQKQSKHVRVPLRLDLQQFEFIYQERPAVYQLTSIACHSGSLHSGHYFAILRKGEDQWVKVDDDHVQPLTDVQQVLKFIEQFGYLFFFSRCAFV
jgi:ubiquitin C-terminal hydrolase